MVIQACRPSIQEAKRESLSHHSQQEGLQDTFRSQNDTNQTVYNCLCAKRWLITFHFLGNN